MHCQTENVRMLTGYTSDLKHLLPDNKQASLSLYLVEHSLHCQTENVCILTGYTSDLKHLLPENKQANLSLYLFDEYLQKAVYKLHNNSGHSKLNFGSNKELHLVHKDVSFIPLPLCAPIKRRCFKYIWFAVSSAIFMNNFNVLFI
jgi:hypothetical protein